MKMSVVEGIRAGLEQSAKIHHDERNQCEGDECSTKELGGRHMLPKVPRVEKYSEC
jgi:hypothetical protein